MRVGRKAKAERVPVQPGGAGDRGRHDRALVPVAHRRPPLAAADPAPRPGRPARRAGRRSPARRPTGSIIEQSELDAAIAAIRAAFERSPRRPAPRPGPPG